MDLSTWDENDVAVVKAVGDLNAATSGRLEQMLDRLIGGGRKRLVLDMSEVRYVSSAGLRVFLIAAKRLAGGGVLYLAGVNEPVRQVLEMTGLLGILKLVPDVPQGVKLAGG